MLEAVEEQRAVGQPGERVVESLVRELLLGRLAVGDVDEQPTPVGSPVGPALYGGLVAHPDRMAVAVQEPVLLDAGRLLGVVP